MHVQAVLNSQNVIYSELELGQMVSILKYCDIIRYRYETFKVSSFDWIVLYYRYQYLFRQLNSLCRDFQIYTVVLA